MPLLPNDVILDVTVPRSTSGYITLKSPPKMGLGGYPHSRRTYCTIRKGGFLFSCCGASDITGLSTTMINEAEAQSFVSKLYTAIEGGQTYYFIADSGQLRSGNNRQHSPWGNVATILIALGAQEVSALPNMNHGPNKMHLHAWAPRFGSNEFWRKYLHFYTGGSQAPLWWHALSEEDKQKRLEASMPEVMAMAETEKRIQTAQQTARENSAIANAAGYARSGKLDFYLKQYGWRKENEEVRTVGPQEATVHPWSDVLNQNRG